MDEIDKPPIKAPHRKNKRKKILTVIDLYKSISDAPVGQGCLIDISYGGASIESTVIFAKEQPIILNIPLSENDRYSITGKVLRIQKLSLQTYNYGIRFEKMSFMERLKLVMKVIPVLLKGQPI